MTTVLPILAYLDPGLGSMQFQVLLAALLGVTFFVKSSLVQARDFLGRLTKKGG